MNPNPVNDKDDWEASNEEIREVAEKFVMANCYDPKVAAQFFNDS